MRNFTTVVCIVVYTGCAITACTTYPTRAHATSLTDEHTLMDMQDDYEASLSGMDARSQRIKRLEDELQRVRDQLYYMRDRTPNTVPGIPTPIGRQEYLSPTCPACPPAPGTYIIDVPCGNCTFR